MKRSIRAAICRIDVILDGETKSRGTGTLVAPGIVLTALHVVADRKASPPKPHSGLLLLTFPDHKTAARIHGDYLNANEDWVLLECEVPPSVPPVPMGRLSQRQIDWETYGWPDANSRDGMTLTGTVENCEGELDGVTALQLFSKEAAAGAGAKVSGLSGGPVIVDGWFVGHMRFALMQAGRTEAGTVYACPAATVAKRCPTVLTLGTVPYRQSASTAIISEMLVGRRWNQRAVLGGILLIAAIVAALWITRRVKQQALNRAAAELSLDTGLSDHLSRVLNARGSEIPFGPERIDQLRGAVARIATSIHGDLDRLGESGREAWPTAQTLLAVDGVLPLDTARLTRFLAASADSACACWREIPQSGSPRNVATTGWITLALAAMRVPIGATHVAFFLSEQDSDGWWSVFLVANRPDFASTYGTAWAMLGLSSQIDAGLLRAPDSAASAAAIARATSWLLGARESNRPRWKDYPDSRLGRESLSLSGLALHVLHRIAPSATGQVDALWLDSLPVQAPTANEAEHSLQWIDGKDGRHQDSFEQSILPWVLIGTVDAWASGTSLQRARALLWLERASLQQSVLEAETQSESWRRAELLIALKYLLARTSK